MTLIIKVVPHSKLVQETSQACESQLLHCDFAMEEVDDADSHHTSVQPLHRQSTWELS